MPEHTVVLHEGYYVMWHYVFFSQRIFSTAKQCLKYIIQQADGLDLSQHSQLPHYLLDLANYRYDDLSQESLVLLNRYYSLQSDIFERALQMQLLKTPQSYELYNTVEGILLDLSTFLSSGSGAGVVPSPVKLLTTYCWLDEEVEGYELHQINQKIILSFGKFFLAIPLSLAVLVSLCDACRNSSRCPKLRVGVLLQ